MSGNTLPATTRKQVFRCDTLQFCVAQMLGISPSLVPDFENEGTEWKDKFENWLHARFNIDVIPVPPNFHFRGVNLGIFMDSKTPKYRWPDGEDYHSIFFAVLEADGVRFWPNDVNSSTSLLVQKLIFVPLDITTKLGNRTTWVN